MVAYHLLNNQHCSEICPEENPPEESSDATGARNPEELHSPDQDLRSAADYLSESPQSEKSDVNADSGNLQPVEAIVVAEFADTYEASPGSPARDSSHVVVGGPPDPAALRRFHDVVSTPLSGGSLDNISANGGAVGALVLGIWSLVGVFITNWSIINGILGLLLGFWGLTSGKRRMAWIGIGLCVLSIFLSLIQVSESVDAYLNSVDESSL